ncbi:hypothetical protein [Paenibacillus cymbidii]|uniref:hypothetical protein n=1 Tax=Paenibacillus cymbidii TaxID=1639034 RepID=UPI0010807851|nr:hypothetical protein [Paenibacillus cymbidii]
MDDKMDLLTGIGPEVQLGDGITKRLRVGTIKQIRDVGALYKDKLLRAKAAVMREGAEQEEQITKWVEILNLVLIEGFTREEFEDSVPELMESAVDRFLFG